MKFKVREGFVCLVDVAQKNEKGEVVGVVTNTHPGGSSVEFDAKTAKQHAHKLEAICSEAKKFLEPPELPKAEGADEVAQLKATVAALSQQVADLSAASKK